MIISSSLLSLSRRKLVAVLGGVRGGDRRGGRFIARARLGASARAAKGVVLLPLLLLLLLLGAAAEALVRAVWAAAEVASKIVIAEASDVDDGAAPARPAPIAHGGEVVVVIAFVTKVLNAMGIVAEERRRRARAGALE